LLSPRVSKLVNDMIAGDKNALAQLISMAENENPNLPEIIEMLSPHLGKAFSIGITGPPGAGKSTLIGNLAGIIRSKGLKVGIIAVDPISPISGGAILGDRIRMPQLDMGEGVFIRSMTTRGGSQGGLSKATAPAIKLLDAFGKDIIIIETVGVGQTELGVKDITDVFVLVLTPGFGDAIQVMKAGLIEVADIIVVNKADLEGADRLLAELRVTLIPNDGGSKQSIIATQATNDIGIEQLYQEIEKYRRSS